MHGYLSADIFCSNCELRGTDNVQGQISVHMFEAKFTTSDSSLNRRPKKRACDFCMHNGHKILNGIKSKLQMYQFMEIYLKWISRLSYLLAHGFNQR